jgi:UrcA family protein
MKLINFVCTAIITLTPFCVAHAMPNDNTAQTVKFGDLDLTKEAGLATLYQRIRRAAADVCDHAGEIGFGPEVPSVEIKCYRQAVGDAAQRIGRPEFIAYVAAHSGAHVTTQVAAR